MSTLAEQIRAFRDWVKEHNHLERKNEKYGPPAGLHNKPTDLSEDAAVLGRKILAAVMADRAAYEPAPEPGVQLHKEAIQENPPNPNAKNDDGEPLFHLESHQVQYMLEVLKPLPPALIEKQNLHGLGVAGRDLKSAIYPQGPLSRFNDKLKKELGLDGQLLYRKLAFELEAARNNPDAYNTNTPTIQKIQRGVQVYSEGRAADALTILETVRNEDPHNKLASYVLSNIFYHRAAEGHRKFLPQAREEAKKAATRIDKISNEITNRFRYNYIALDGFFGPERQLEIIRDFGFMKPPALEASDEEHAHYIKSMVFMSLTNAGEWSNEDVGAVRAMAENYLGGALLFALFFEHKILPLVLSDNEDLASHFAPLRDVIHTIQGIQYHLNTYKQTVAENFAENVEQVPPEYWTINRRMMRLAAKGLPAPSIEMFLANTSLDGELFGKTENLDRTMREAELQLGEYWLLWILKLNFTAHGYSPYTLPEKIALEEQEILPKVVQALEDLKRQEAKLIDPEKWSLSSHYQPKYTYENLAEIGLAHAFTAMSFAPKLATLRNHYQVWGAVLPTALLPSDIIEARAKAGAFANMHEITTVIDGALKILTDQEYGIHAAQAKAWKTYLEMQNRAENSKHGSGRMNDLLAEIWWFFPMLLLAVLGFAAVSSASSIGSGVKIFAMLVVAGIAVIGGVIVIQRSKRVAARPQPQRHHMDADGNTTHMDPQDDNDEDLSLQDLAGK